MIPLLIWEMHILGSNSYYIGLLNCSPILAIVTNGGEILEGLREYGLLLKFGLCLSVSLSCIPYLFDVLHGWIYSGNSTEGLSCQCMQWNSSSSHMHILWGSLLYILWFYSHILHLLSLMWVQSILIWTSIFVILDHIKYNLLCASYSRISCILVSNIHYINPLVEIVINYQNGGDWKGTLPPCVVLVINDNPYGLMIFYWAIFEGIFHR